MSRSERPEPKTVDQARAVAVGDIGEHSPKAPEVRAVQSLAIDSLGRDHANRDRRRGSEHRVVELSTLLRLDLFRVVQPRKTPHADTAQRVVVEEDTCDDQRAGERAAPRFIRPGDASHTESTIEPEQPLAGREHAPRISAGYG